MTPLRDVTDVRDVVRAYRLLMERGEPGAVYNVCRGRAVSVKEIAEELLAMAARPMHLVVDQTLQRPVDIPVLVGDNGALRAATGWAPTIPLETTLADVLADWRARLGC
jgi:GDP-4-dehydro-6-deoxy-D-mannose reductase